MSGGEMLGSLLATGSGAPEPGSEEMLEADRERWRKIADCRKHPDGMMPLAVPGWPHALEVSPERMGEILATARRGDALDAGALAQAQIFSQWRSNATWFEAENAGRLLAAAFSVEEAIALAKKYPKPATAEMAAWWSRFISEHWRGGDMPARMTDRVDEHGKILELGRRTWAQRRTRDYRAFPREWRVCDDPDAKRAEPKRGGGGF